MEFHVSGPLSAATIGAGQTLEIGSAYSGTVTFTANTGALKLETSSSFTGTVSGLTGQDTLDLVDINFATMQQPSFSGTSSVGTLTVTDGMHTAVIALSGNYLSSAFVPSNDGRGGTSIVDPLLGGLVAANDSAMDAGGPRGGLDQNIALLSNYIASTFVSSGSGNGGSSPPGSHDSASGQGPNLAGSLSNYPRHG